MRITPFARRGVLGALPLRPLLLCLTTLAPFASVPRAPAAEAAAPAAEPIRFDLPAGPAGRTLADFAEQSGRQIVFLADTVRGVITPAMHRELPVRAALDRLLAGTGLTVVEDSRSGALLVSAPNSGNSTAARSAHVSASSEPRPKSTVKTRNPLVLLGAWLGLALAPAAPAAENAGAVAGRVFNPATSEYMNNAEVRLDGTNQVTFTEGDGSFQLIGVAAGPASITVTYSGYNTAKESFTVSAGQTAVREINLTSTAAAGKDGVVRLQAFTVSSEREGNSKAIQAQRRSMSITTSVASDIFGDVADNNVGEFLKYLPGVDLDYVETEARGPRIGGMDTQYVGVTFDGIRSASADAFRGGGAASRGTSFEGFSLTAIESIEINRTTTPDADADNPAGTINMRTKRAFERRGRTLSFSSSLSFNAEEFTLGATQGPRDGLSYKWKPNFSFDYGESFLNNRVGVLVSVSRAYSYTEEDAVNMGYNRTPNATDPRPMVTRLIDIRDGGKTLQKDALTLTADWKATPNLVLSFTGIYNYAENEFWNRNFTFIAANDNANVANGRNSVGGDGLLTLIARRQGAANAAALNNTGNSGAKLTYTRTASPRFEWKSGRWVVDGALGYSRAVNNYEAHERGFIQSEGGGVAGGFIATRPHLGSWEWEIRQTSGADWFDARSFVDTNTRSGGARVSTDDRTWITEIQSAQANARWALPFLGKMSSFLKFGGKIAEESRDNNILTNWNIWSYAGPGGSIMDVNPATGANRIATVNGVVQAGNWASVGPQFISPHLFDTGTTNGLTAYNIAGQKGTLPRINRQEVLRLFRAQPGQFVHTGTPEDYYTSFFANPRDFKQTLTAGYAQLTTRISPRLTLLGGVRMEQTENAVKEFDPLTRAQVLAAGYTVNAPGTSGGRALTVPGLIYQYTTNPKITRRGGYRNYFPSIMLKYYLTPDFEFQLGWNKAISRPPVDNITGLWGINEVDQIVTAPNPELRPEFHKKFQARLAYYFRGQSPGQLTLDLTQNKATNFRQTFEFSADEFGVTDPDFASYRFRTTINSPDEQTSKAMDLAYNQTLGFLPGEYLRGLNFNVAFSRAYADRRRGNLAPYRLSSRLSYTYGRLNTFIGMVHRPDTPASTTYGDYFGALTQFDAAVNWRLTRRFTLYSQVRNLTNRPRTWFHTPPGVVEGQQRVMRQMQKYPANWVFGVRGRF